MVIPLRIGWMLILLMISILWAVILMPMAGYGPRPVNHVPADQALNAPAVSLPETAPVWYVEDLRPSEAPVEVLDGLKALVTSVFGEYTPITTTSVITETVGSETHQYLVETVAPGAAGVDYEWLAGVFLFGILLFCLMKLLGGVIS